MIPAALLALLILEAVWAAALLGFLALAMASRSRPPEAEPRGARAKD